MPNYGMGLTGAAVASEAHLRVPGGWLGRLSLTVRRGRADRQRLAIVLPVASLTISGRKSRHICVLKL